MADSVVIPIDISQLEARPPVEGDSLLLISADKKSVARLNVMVNSDTEPSLVYVVQTTPDTSTDGDKVPTVSSLGTFLSAASGAVRFDELQTAITNEQAAQARSNIKAVGNTDLTAAIQQHNISSSAHANIVAGLATKTELAQKLNITDAADTYATVADLDAVKVTAESAVTPSQMTSAIGTHNSNADAHATKFNTLESNLTAQINQKLSIEQASSTYATLTQLNNLSAQVVALTERVAQLESLQESYPTLDAQGAITVKGINFYDDQLTSPQAFSIGMASNNTLATRKAVYVQGQLPTINGIQYISVASGTGNAGLTHVYGRFEAEGNSNFRTLSVLGELSCAAGITNHNGIYKTPSGTPVQLGAVTLIADGSAHSWMHLNNVGTNDGIRLSGRTIGATGSPVPDMPIWLGCILNMNSHSIINLSQGVNNGDAVNVSQLSSIASGKVNYQELTREEFELLPRPLPEDTLFRVTQS